LLEGTPITLANGRDKPVEMIRKGDQVLAYDESSGTMRASEVVSVHAPYDVDHYFVINEEIRATENHPMLSDGRWVAAGQLRIGDWLTGPDNQDILVTSVRQVEGKARVFNFQVAAGTYVADGVIVHNKEDCEQYVQYCPSCE
jgi:hypothetical protein